MAKESVTLTGRELRRYRAGQAMTEAVRMILADLDTFNDVLQVDENREYGPTAAVGHCRAAFAEWEGRK